MIKGGYMSRKSKQKRDMKRHRGIKGQRQPKIPRSPIVRRAVTESAKLMKDLSARTSPFESIVRAIAGSDQISVSSPQETEIWLKIAEEHTAGFWQTLEPTHAIPLLLQAITDYYNGQWKQNPSWAGMALKRVLELSFKNVYSPQSAYSWSLPKLTEGIIAATVAGQLQTIQTALTIFGRDDDWAIFNGTRFELSNRLDQVRQESAAAYIQRGKSFRTLAASVNAIWFQPWAVLPTIERILQGESPQNQNALKGTLFSELRDDEPQEFWAGIWVYFRLFSLILTKSAVNLNTVADIPREMKKNDIVLFQRPHFPAPQGIEAELIEQSIDRLLWDEAWYKRRVTEVSGELIVERPAVPLGANKKLFVSSVPLIGDALNWFVEASMMHYQGAGGVSLSDDTFERLISKPFEQQVTERFRAYGFLAGEVLHSGHWRNTNLTLTAPSGGKIPGQIDVLAYSEQHQLVFVIECKVLQDPLYRNQLRNLVGKIGDADQERFHAKLRDRIAWLQRTEKFASIPHGNFIGVIVLDHKTPGMKLGEYPVCDPELLQQVIEQRLAQ
jgi:hypothetical protein